MIMQTFIASENVYSPTRNLYAYKRCISDVYTPPIEQSDWSECYNHGTSR
jgi:hypothetical protein